MAYFWDYFSQNGESPTYREIGKHMGISRVTALEHVVSLIGKGLVVRQGRGNRNLTPVVEVVCDASFEVLDEVDEPEDEPIQLPAGPAKGRPKRIGNPRDDDGLLDRIAQARQAKAAEYVPDVEYDDEDEDYDGNIQRNQWPAKAEARIAKTTERLSRGIWTWQGDELKRAKRPVETIETRETSDAT